MESGSMFSNTPSDTAAPVEEIFLSDSDEEELQHSLPPNLIFVPGNGAEMIDESGTAELQEEVHPMSSVNHNAPEKFNSSSGFASEQKSSGSKQSEESISRDTETEPEDVTACKEPVADVLNPFFCDFEELNRHYFGVVGSQDDSCPMEKFKTMSPQSVRKLAIAQLEQLDCEGRRQGQKRIEDPKHFEPRSASKTAGKETALEETKTSVVSMKQCFVRVNRLSLDTLIKNGVSQSSIELFTNQEKANAIVGMKSFPPKAVNCQMPLNFSNRCNVSGQSSKWSAANMADRLKALSDEALIALNQLESLDKNKNAKPCVQSDFQIAIPANLLHTIVIEPETGAIPNIKSVNSETAEEKLISFDKVSSLNDLKTKTKDLRVLIKDLKTEKIVRIGNRIKPVSEILSETCMNKVKTKDHFVPIIPTNVQAPVISSPYFGSSNAPESSLTSRNQFTENGNRSASNANQSVESLESKTSSFPFKPRLSVRKDLFAHKISPSSTSPPIIPSPYSVSDPGTVDPLGKKESFVDSSKVINGVLSSSLKIVFKDKILNNLKDKMSKNLSSVSINPNATSYVQQCNSVPPKNANGKRSHYGQFKKHVGLYDTNAEQISAFADKLLSFLPKASTSSNSKNNKQKQPMTQSSSISMSFSKYDQSKETFKSMKKNGQKSFTMHTNGPFKSCETSQPEESEIMSDSENVSSCVSDSNQPKQSAVLCEKTGLIIDTSGSFPKNIDQESVTRESSENISSKANKTSGQESLTVENNSTHGSSGTSQRKESEVMSDSDNVSSCVSDSDQPKHSAVLCEKTGLIIDTSGSFPKNIDPESVTRESSKNISSKVNKTSGQESLTVENNSTHGSSETSQPKESGVMSNSENVSSCSSDSQQSVILCERTGQVKDKDESFLTTKQDQESVTSKSCANLPSNSLSERQSLSHDSEAEARSKQLQQSTMSKNTQNSSQSQKLDKEQIMQNNKMCTASAKNSPQRETSFCKNANLELSSRPELKDFSTHKSMNSGSDHSESPSTSFIPLSNDKLVELPNPEECEKQNLHENSSGNVVLAKMDAEHQLLSEGFLGTSNLVMKTCFVALEDCKKLITKKSSDRMNSLSQTQPAEEDCERKIGNESLALRKITRSRLSEVGSIVRSKSPEMMNKRLGSREAPKEGISTSSGVQKEIRSVSQKATSSESSVVSLKKRPRSSNDGNECPRKKQKSDSPFSQQLTPVIFDLADERFPGFSVINDILAVDGTFDIDSSHEEVIPYSKGIQIRVKKEAQRKGVIPYGLEFGDESMTYNKTVIDNPSEKTEQQSKNPLKSLFTHIKMQLFDVGSIPFDGKILNEFHLDGNLDSETSDDEVLLKKRARLEEKNEVPKARSNKMSKLTMKKQLNSSRSLPESSDGTKCSEILSDFAAEKSLISVSSKKISDPARKDSDHKISEIKSSPNLKAFDQRNKTDEKLTGQKPVIKVIRLNYDEVKDGISVLDLGRTLSATSRSTLVNRRKQGKPRKYGFNINNRNGGVKSSAKVISDLHFMVRNPKKRSK